MQKIDSHNNFLFFTASLVFLLLASGFVGSTPDGEDHLFLQAVILATELVAYMSLSLSARWRNFVIVMVIFNLTTALFRENTVFEFSSRVSLAASMAFYTGMAYIGSRQVFSFGNIELNTIVGTIAIYLMLGIIWSLLYLAVLEVWPNGVNGIEYRDWHDNLSSMLYFSFVTMTTLGYGDITPAKSSFRTLAYLQAVAGSFYMAVVVASLVGSFISKSR